MSKDRLKRLQQLEARLLRPKFKPFPYAAATAELVWILVCHAAVKAGRASLLPLSEPTADTPAKLAAHALLDHIHSRLTANERAAKAERKRAKRERRRDARKAATAPEPEVAHEHGLPLESLPAPTPVRGARLLASEPGRAPQVLPLQ